MESKVDNSISVVKNFGLHNMIKVKNSYLEYFHETPLYCETGKGMGFEIYKHEFTYMDKDRLAKGRYPEKLYMHVKDKLTGLREMQRGLNKQLETDMGDKDPVKVKSTLINLVAETLQEPVEGSIAGAVDTVEIVFSEYLNNKDVIDNLIHVMTKDYSTAAHSVNVMALILKFSYFSSFEEEQSKKLGLSALLHDAGKLKVSGKLLKASRRLTDDEFVQVKQHTIFGYEILKACNLPEEICLCALNHHERMDGSGYPNGIRDFSEEAQIIGFIDCYEALTCNERPYRDAVSPFSALSLIKTELFKGNFNYRLYEKFVKSLR